MRHVSGTARENTKELVTNPSPSQEYLSRDLAVVQDPEVLLDLHFVLGSPIDGHHCPAHPLQCPRQRGIVA